MSPVMILDFFPEMTLGDGFKNSRIRVNLIFSISLRDALSALDKVGINKDIFGCDPVPKETFIRRTKEVLEEKQANYVKKE